MSVAERVFDTLCTPSKQVQDSVGGYEMGGIFKEFPLLIEGKTGGI